MPTRKALERLAEQAERDRVAWQARADAAERQRDELRRMAEDMKAAEEALLSMKADSSMLGSKMELQNAGAKSKRVKIAASMTEQETDAKRALLAANLTPQDVADALGVGRSTVNAWCNGTRSIPRRYRDRLKKDHRIPPGVWKKTAE
jgi:DNA-binding transcriptional regulator YiaG